MVNRSNQRRIISPICSLSALHSQAELKFGIYYRDVMKTFIAGDFSLQENV